MSDSSRPKYVPGRFRRKQQQRFHGAFTGGFSAGFFNTVGTKEGWKPREETTEESHPDVEDPKPIRPQQKLEDFMDEQDHDEWGGPTSIRRDYKDTNQASSASKATTIENWMKITVEPPANVGNRLLRVLGWREGNSSAYVPTKGSDGNNDTAIPEAKVLLSKKRLRKVQLQQERVKIPPPKLDTCGLGFEPYENAPEFKAFREKRKKQAQQRARLGQHTRDVYRVSDVLGEDDQDKKGDNAHQHNPSDDPYVSYETIEDFVGQRSVGGFALREDEDDAYDDQPLSLTKVSDKVQVNKEEYHTEIYEHSSDDETNHTGRQGMGKGSMASTTKKTNGTNLLGVLSSFAGIDGSTAKNDTHNNSQSQNGGVTSDGRPPLNGFVLGGAVAPHSMSQRYKGPDVPITYEVKRHEFGPDENPMVLKALSRAVQLEVIDEKRKQAMNEALRANASSNTPSNRFQPQQTRPLPRSQAPMAGGAFSGLAAAMKSRFTSVVEKPSEADKPNPGLHIPSKEKDPSKSKTEENSTTSEKPETAAKDIRMRRTVHPFVPHRLLCKRFHVPVPQGSAHLTTDPIGAGRVTEASYFQQEILNPAAAAAGVPSSKPQAVAKTTNNKKAEKGLQSLFNEDGTMKDEVFAGESTVVDNRPPVETYKSIFEPSADNDDDDDDDDDESVSDEKAKQGAKISVPEEKETTKMDNGPATETELGQLKSSGKEDGDDGTTAGAVESNQAITESSMVKYEKDKKKKKKRSKRRKRDSDYDDESSSDSEGRRRRRHRKKRSRSVSSDSSDLSRDSASTDDRKEKKKRKDRKDRKKHKHKKKKKSKRS